MKSPGATLLAIFLLPLGQQPWADQPLPPTWPSLATDSTGRLLAWLLQGGHGAPSDVDEQLGQRLRRIEALYTDGAHRAAAALAVSWLLQAPPARELPVMDNLRFLAAGALAAAGATASARHWLLELVRRRPASDFRPAALRKLVDITLESGDYEGGLKPLVDFTPEAEEVDEIAYLKGRALASLGYGEQASQVLSSVGRHSRFRAAALYLLGILALERKDLEAAEDFFCRIVHQPGAGRYTFFVSQHTGEIMERAWLALARLRHDRGDYWRAVDTYDRLTADSVAGRTAAWEKAWALYRLERHRESLLALEASGAEETFSPLRAEAWLLRGYALVGQCEFEQAITVFERLLKELQTMAEESAESAALIAPPIDAWPAGPEKEAAVLAGEAQDTFAWAMSLSGEVRRLLSGLWSRWLEPDEEELARDLEAERSRAQGLRQRAITMRPLVGEAEGRELEDLIAQLAPAGERATAGSRKLSLHRALAGGSPLAPDATRLPVDYLAEELRGLRQLAQEVGKLVEAVALQDERARRRVALVFAHRARHFARLAHLGKIDAELGRKQALEIEVENLALGQYPLSLYRELAASGQLGPEIEYWPYDGEGWPDEMEGE